MGTNPRETDVDQLREYLTANNGIANLEVLTPDNTQRIVELFHRDGFVAIEGVLTRTQIDMLADECSAVVDEIVALDREGRGNRGAHRYSFGGSSMTRSQLHRPAWQMLLQLEVVTDLVARLFNSQNFMLRAASGDFCLPGAVDYQPLHADVRDFTSSQDSPFSSFQDPRGLLSIRDLPCPYICVNFLPQDVTPLNGPTRQIPGTQNARAPIPRLCEEPEWMKLSTVCPLPAGSIMIRDTRAWHGGTPNVSDQVRSIPNLEFYAPWFREPMVAGIEYDHYTQLNQRARQLVQHLVIDSSETLDTRTTLKAP